MNLNNLLQQHHIILRSTSETWQEVLREIGGTFTVPDEVTDQFVEALLEREQIYPTGLPVSPVAVALPHVEGKYVHKPGLALCALNRPVRFQEMGNPDSSVSVQLVICIALPEEKRDEQAIVLAQLIDKIQNPGFVQSVMNAKAATAVLKAFGSV